MRDHDAQSHGGQKVSGNPWPPKRPTSYEKRLDRVVALLKRKGPLTAKAVVAELGCSRPSAYAYLDALRRQKRVRTTVRRGSVTGPASKFYQAV